MNTNTKTNAGRKGMLITSWSNSDSETRDPEQRTSHSHLRGAEGRPRGKEDAEHMPPSPVPVPSMITVTDSVNHRVRPRTDTAHGSPRASSPISVDPVTGSPHSAPTPLTPSLVTSDTIQPTSFSHFLRFSLLVSRLTRSRFAFLSIIVLVLLRQFPSRFSFSFCCLLPPSPPSHGLSLFSLNANGML